MSAEIVAGGGQEHDRQVARPVAALDQARGLEAVEAGHPHVEQDQRVVALEQHPQRLVARGGGRRSGRPSGASTASSVLRFSGRSSTSRIGSRSPAVSSASAFVAFGLLSFRSQVALYASSQTRIIDDQLIDIDRLGDVVRRAGRDRLLAVALHRLGRQRDDRQALEPGHRCGSPAPSRSRPSRAS